MLSGIISVPLPGRSIAKAWYPLTASIAIVPSSSQVLDVKACPCRRTTCSLQNETIYFFIYLKLTQNILNCLKINSTQLLQESALSLGRNCTLLSKMFNSLFQRKPPNRTNVHSIYRYLGSICRPVASIGRASLKNSGGSPGSCPVRMDTLVVESRGGEVAVSDIFWASREGSMLPWRMDGSSR